MAEAIVNGHLSEDWQGFSAGTQPAGYVHPLALRVLAEIGIEHQGFSKSTDQFQNQHFDLVITVCDEAIESCPLWLGRENRVHVGFPDPAKTVGSEDEILEVFRKTRDEIVSKIIKCLKDYSSKQ